MRLALKFAATCALVVAGPASAQLLGGSGGGGLGGQLGGNLGGQLGGTLGNSGRTVTGTLDGATDVRVDRDVDRRRGRANARARGNARGESAVDALGRSATLGGNASGDAGADAQLVGTDQLRGTTQSLRGTAGGAVGGGAAHLAAAGSAAANSAGAISVSPGMIVRDTSGRAIGRVQAVRARSNGMVDNVIVRVGDRLATLPDDNFSASGSALVSAMGEADLRRASRGQQTAQQGNRQRSRPDESPSSNARGQRSREVDKQ
jgi:hypothetical protein